MPKLLLSANGLVILSLSRIPDSGFISPDAMATALTVMTRLESLTLLFDSPRSHPDPAGRPLPPPTRFVLPALTKLAFGGVCEYSENLLARIDAPRLYNLFIGFFMDLNFEVPQLHRFIGHVEAFKVLNFAQVFISDGSIGLRVVDHDTRLELRTKCSELDWQLSSLAQVCTSSSSFPLISALEELEIRETSHLPFLHWKNGMKNSRCIRKISIYSFTCLLFEKIEGFFVLHSS